MSSPALFRALIRGVGAALVTLFDDDGAVLVDRTARHAAALVERGVKAVLVAGTSGEPWRLTPHDRQRLVQAVPAAVPAGIPVIAGTGDDDTAQAARLTAMARDGGADAVLVMAPAGENDLTGYYTAVAAAAAPLPVLAYHLPLLSAPGVGVRQLAGLPVAGIKDSSGDAERLMHTVHDYRGQIYVGSPALLALAGPVGADGALLALANTHPELCAAAFTGVARAQRELIGPHLASLRNFPAALKPHG